MSPDIIAQVQRCGFDVYMRDSIADSYLYFTDGTNIGYLQEHRFGGVSLSTVHIPNQYSGTGFNILERADTFTCEDLRKGFEHAPLWAFREHRDSVRKYKDMAAFLNADSFNRTFKLVSPVEANSDATDAEAPDA